ncbi:DgyrCDS11187 [Dimorphilus gyrociliatus]|uniref:DgyrCDS11187 n=1 Tax=Dimorphilus gyrociliatus TaxID=2664684 RepID=A0A7I8W526_9ANNE|nr:DgyrCDS11187 [Dimorphilus gyrociliatus]
MIEVKVAHTEGHSDFTFSSDGSQILSCGREGDVKIWDVNEDKDPKTISVGECITAIDFSENAFFVGVENVVRKYTYPDAVDDGTVVRFTGTVTSVKVKRDFLFSASSDFTAKLVKISNFKILLNISQHEAPILAVDLQSSGQTLATASLDGYVKIWDQTGLCMEKHKCIPIGNDFHYAKTLCKLAFSPNGEHLAVPNEKTVDILFEDELWACNFSLKTNIENHEFINVVCFSSTGKNLSAATVDGHIFMWNLKSKELIFSERHPHKRTITSLSWNPSKEQLIFTDKQGQLCLTEELKLDENYKESAKEESEENLNDLFDDRDSDVDISAIKKKTLSAFGFEDEEDLATGGTQIIDDENSEMESKTKIKEIIKHVPIDTWKPKEPQKAFQPGSTPLHLPHRFMMWNMVGVIRHYQTEDENSIDITFHDKATHHAVHIHNDANYIMGDVSKKCFVLGSIGDDDNQSSVMCEHFASWDSNKRWILNLENSEKVEALCIGEKWIALATDLNFIRLISISGVQLQVFCSPGKIVCMSAFQDQLMIVYHKGIPYDCQSSLAIKIMKIAKTFKCEYVEQLCLSPASSLSWIGFTQQGSPCTVDSRGIVRMLVKSFGNSWVPISNLKDHTKGKSDGYFVVGICEESEQIRCIFCKGSTYPPTLPWPVITTLSIRLPFANSEEDKTKLEEKLWRTVVLKDWLEAFDDEDKKRQLDIREQEVLIRMFAMACKQDREYRAIEIARMTKNSHNAALTSKYAAKLGLMSLAERLNDVIREKSEEEELNFLAAKEQPVEDNSQRKTLDDSSQRDDDEVMIKPKPTSTPLLFRSESPSVDSLPSTPQSQNWQNPFKANDSGNSTPILRRGSSVFDDLKPTSREKLKGDEPQKAVKRKSTTQTTLTPSSSKKKKENIPTAFGLWLEENKESLEEENPDVSSEDMAVLAAKRFKALPKEERQIYAERIKQKTTSEDNKKPEKKSGFDKLNSFTFNKI